MQRAGLGKPAYFVACLAGPSGKSLYKYRLLAFASPNSAFMALVSALIAGEVL
jgi:hypothetical protein